MKVCINSNDNLYFIPLTLDKVNIIKDIFTQYKNSQPSTKAELTLKFHTLIEDQARIENTIAIGDTNLSNQQASSIIEFIPLSDSKRAYKCFTNKDWKLIKNNVILHEDGASSWKCLMGLLRNPQYGMIIKIL